ncbi:MAG: double-cubane-cluster-containing anaerobic reductase [Planctomycetota bacterium]|jgi:benzoyl-CoA reductase/2-hydroxyglutaryl-CoA dehydratase subunit BcrC/BadD/HgdB
MTECRDARKRDPKPDDCEETAGDPCCSGPPDAAAVEDPQAWFGRMIPNCLEHARAAKASGAPVVGIMCEFTPRELIMAAGGVPVCLCGGSAATIPPAEEDLPANLCALIKSTYGYHVRQSNPFLEMADLVVAETTCDGKKKMYELMAESRPMFVLELPQKADDDDAFDHWLRELEKLRGFLEERFGVPITDERIRQAIRVMNRERDLRRRLAALMKADVPPLAGRELLDLKSSISGIPADFQQYEKALDAFQTRPPRCDLADRVRVLMTGVPMAHGAERVLDIVEANGGLVVAMESCTGLKPILEDVDADADDPVRALAEKYFRLPCSVMTRNDRRLDVLRQLAAEYRPECVVDLIWQACLTYDVESSRVKRLAEQELGLPYLRIETDYSPSDSARIATRVEALFETIRAVGGAEANRA